MKTYVISVPVTDAHIFHVEAESEAAALEALNEAFDAGDSEKYFMKTYDGHYKTSEAECIDVMDEVKHES